MISVAERKKSDLELGQISSGDHDLQVQGKRQTNYSTIPCRKSVQATEHKTIIQCHTMTYISVGAQRSGAVPVGCIMYVFKSNYMKLHACISISIP